MQCIASSVVFVAVETCSNNSPSSSGAFRVATAMGGLQLSGVMSQFYPPVYIEFFQVNSPLQVFRKEFSDYMLVIQYYLGRKSGRWSTKRKNKKYIENLINSIGDEGIVGRILLKLIIHRLRILVRGLK
jgi:hypothetical protein